jgi:hypothetical protein
MPESTKELSGEELDRAVAERVMGNTLPEVWSDPTVGPSHGDPGGYRIGVRPYSSSIEAAMQVEDRIAELGLKTRYVLELAKIVDSRGSRDDKIMSLWWALVHASAEQRCRAALAVIGSKE